MSMISKHKVPLKIFYKILKYCTMGFISLCLMLILGVRLGLNLVRTKIRLVLYVKFKIKIIFKAGV